MGFLKKLFTAVHNAARRAESRWFDWTRNVHTFGEVSLENAGILPERAADSKRYVPARAANVREALQAVPADDLSRYTFVDLGSGKGRGLFVAAELPFHRIVGVELSASLHQIACRNVASFCYRGLDGSRITTLAQDAATFAFPDGPLVIYMFNPFGPVTMQTVLNNLERCLRTAPNHVVIILLWPILGNLVLQIPGMRLIRANKRFQMYEVNPAMTHTAMGARIDDPAMLEHHGPRKSLCRSQSTKTSFGKPSSSP